MVAKNETINVTVGDTKITVDQMTVRLDYKDTVKWKSTSGKPFTIEFKNKKTPFDKDKFSFDEAAKERSPRRDVKKDHYKYSVISGSLILDPLIIIEDPS